MFLRNHRYVAASLGESGRKPFARTVFVESPDASASCTKYGNGIALRRMEKVSAVITTVDEIISKLAVDRTTPNAQKLATILGYQ